MNGSGAHEAPLPFVPYSTHTAPLTPRECGALTQAHADPSLLASS